MMGYVFSASPPRSTSNVDDKEATIAAFERHNEHVKATVPAGRLLVYEVSEGWEPLCDFLDLPVPEAAFPYTNTTEEFQTGAHSDFSEQDLHLDQVRSGLGQRGAQVVDELGGIGRRSRAPHPTGERDEVDRRLREVEHRCARGPGSLDADP